MRIWVSVFVRTVAAEAVVLAPASAGAQPGACWEADKDLIHDPEDQGAPPHD